MGIPHREPLSGALIVTLLVDIIGTGDGLGRLLVERQQRFDAAGAWGLLVVVGTLGYLTGAGLGRLQRRMLRGWPPNDGPAGA